MGTAFQPPVEIGIRKGLIKHENTGSLRDKARLPRDPKLLMKARMQGTNRLKLECHWPSTRHGCTDLVNPIRPMVNMTVQSDNSIEAVELWSGPLPYIGFLAEHHWLNIIREKETNRWEVWQFAAAGPYHWGHLHRNLMKPEAWNHGRAMRHHRWENTVAEDLAKRIEDAPENYPWCGRYQMLPGPNRNTFVQWALKDHYPLNWKGWGKSYSLRRMD